MVTKPDSSHFSVAVSAINVLTEHRNINNVLPESTGWKEEKYYPPPKKKLYSKNTSVLSESLVQLGSGTLFKPRIFPHTKDIVQWTA